MTRTAQTSDDHNDEDRDLQHSKRRESAATPPKFKQSPRPKRQGSSDSFNGLHRRRKKRIQW
ncbi:MAG: hypothetical protein WD875_06165 [Pirellulales bacterium]